MKPAILIAALCVSLPASAQVVSPPTPGTPGALGVSRLFSTGTSSGNGADLTEDALSTCSYTLPANTLVNVGDTVHVRAAGTLGATTDSKTVRIRMGGVAGLVIGSAAGSTAGATAWAVDSYVIKTGPSAQSVGSIGVTTAANSSPRANTQAATDTAPSQIVVTGQNATTAVAGSVTCQAMTVNFEH